MKSLRHSSFMAYYSARLHPVLLAYSGTASAQTQAAQPKASLVNDDCLKCHDAPPADIAAAGGKHKDVGCTGCHAGHPPKVKKPIPLCSECHMGKPHFELKGCLGCHKNPHTPLNISFAGKVTDACITCHTPQITNSRTMWANIQPLTALSSHCPPQDSAVYPVPQNHTQQKWLLQTAKNAISTHAEAGYICWRPIKGLRRMPQKSTGSPCRQQDQAQCICMRLLPSGKA